MNEALRAHAPDHHPEHVEGHGLVHVADKAGMVAMLAAKDGPAFFWGPAFERDGPDVELRFYFSVADGATRSGFTVFYATIRRGPRLGDIHGWNGDREKPTLVDSLLCKLGSETLWHGWVRDGEMTAA